VVPMTGEMILTYNQQSSEYIDVESARLSIHDLAKTLHPSSSTIVCKLKLKTKWMHVLTHL